jgi:hypothetical protein
MSVITITFPGNKQSLVIDSESRKIISTHVPQIKSIAWGWGTTLNRYLKGIEHLTNDVAENSHKYSLENYDFSTEANGAVADKVKKVIEWIVEKLKMLARLIAEFMGKVKTFLDNSKHKQAVKLFKGGDCTNKLQYYIDAKNGKIKLSKTGPLPEMEEIERIINILGGDNVLSACDNTIQWLTGDKRKSFDKAFDEFIAKTKIGLGGIGLGAVKKFDFESDKKTSSGRAYWENDVDKSISAHISYIKGYANTMEEALNSIKEVSTDSLKGRPIVDKNYSDSVAIWALKAYPAVLQASDQISGVLQRISENIKSTNKKIDDVNKIIAQNQDTDYARTIDMKYVVALQESVNVLNMLTGKLFGLHIIQAIPTFDKTILDLAGIKMPSKY